LIVAGLFLFRSAWESKFNPLLMIGGTGIP